MNEGHGRSADIWSLGCVVIEMASGRRPWAQLESNYQIMFKVEKDFLGFISDRHTYGQCNQQRWLIPRHNTYGGT